MAVSEFQLALIGTGALAVVAVWSYNIWQEYRLRKAADEIFHGDRADLLVDRQDDAIPLHGSASPVEVAERQDIGGASRIEPVFSDSQNESAATEYKLEAATRVENASHQPMDLVANVVEPGDDLLDPVIELGISLPPEESISTWQSAWRETNKIDFAKRIRWIGRDASSGQWVEADGGALPTVNRAYVSIQLADRQGAIAIDELRVFCLTAEAIVKARGGEGVVIETPTLEEIITHARAIDDFCASVDVQIAIHIVSRSGQVFACSKLRGMLEATGLALAADGLFYLLDGEGRRLLSVCNAGAVPFDLEQMRTGTTSDITFWLDVPRVHDGGRVFDTMVATARQLAEALDGVLVDDQRNPLADKLLSGIGAKVIELQTQMAAHGIPAGGRRALRLFV